MLLKEHRYLVQIGSHTQIFSVHELISGNAGWGDRFRLQIPADSHGEARTVYGASAGEVAEKGLGILTQRLQA